MYRTDKWSTAAVKVELFSCSLDGTHISIGTLYTAVSVSINISASHPPQRFVWFSLLFVCFFIYIYIPSCFLEDDVAVTAPRYQPYTLLNQMDSGRAGG